MKSTIISKFILIMTTLTFCINMGSFGQDSNNSNQTKENQEKAILTVSDIDGNVYQTVKIGSQIWMLENLKTTKYRNGDLIPNISDSIQWRSLSDDAYCDFKNDPSHSKTFGRLYNWFSATDSRNLCPTGWHVPAAEEFNKMVDFLGGKDIAGEKIKSTSNWLNNGNGTNDSGFNGVSCGFRSSNGGFFGFQISNGWWSSTGETLSVYSINSTVGILRQNKKTGNSVRCIKD